MPTKYVSFNGTAIHYFHTGRTTLPDVVPDLSRGELLLFVHAAGSNGNTWQPQLAGFAELHSPLAFDFPGHGRSGGTESLKSVAAYRDCLVGFADALQLRPSVLVGRSMGGAIATEYALAQPARVRALVLVATAARFDLPDAMLETWKNVMNGRAQQPFTTEAFSPATDFAVMREAWMEQVKTDPRVRYFDLVACNQFDITTRLREIKVPTLIIVGAEDPVVPAPSAVMFGTSFRDAYVAVVPDAAHLVNVEQPDIVNGLVLEHLSEGDGGAP